VNYFIIILGIAIALVSIPLYSQYADNISVGTTEIQNSNSDQTSKITEKVPEPRKVSIKLEESPSPIMKQNKPSPEPATIRYVYYYAEVSPTDTSVIDYINQLRIEKNREPISFDSRVYDLALARANDMFEYNYLNYTNPFTNTCPDNMKKFYGLASDEYVVENLNGYLSVNDPNPTWVEKDIKEVIDGWMDSKNNRFNLLFPLHTAGAVACAKGKCVFLGLNHDGYGEGCFTANDSQVRLSFQESCTDEQIDEFDSMQARYNQLNTIAKKFPPIFSSLEEYNESKEIVDEISSLVDRIINFNCS